MRSEVVNRLLLCGTQALPWRLRRDSFLIGHHLSAPGWHLLAGAQPSGAGTSAASAQHPARGVSGKEGGEDDAWQVSGHGRMIVVSLDLFNHCTKKTPK